MSLSTAIITDVSTPATRGKGMALIGVAFSLGFLFGPMIGAAFSIWGKDQTGEWYMYPAVLALVLSVLDVIFLSVFFKVGSLLNPGDNLSLCVSKESLPESRRNSSTSATLSQAYNYLQPLQLFRFASLTNLEKKEHKDLQQIGLAYFIYLFLYSGMEFTLTFLTHIRFGFSPMQQVEQKFDCSKL